MTNIQSKREREEANSAYLKMRSDYRATLTEKPIEFDNADFVDPGTNKILNGPKLVANQKLTVKIPRWTGLPGENESDIVKLMLDKGDGKGFVKVAEHTFLRHGAEADFRENFPYTMVITSEFLPRDATCQLKYEIYYYNDSEDESTPVSFLCDQVGGSPNIFLIRGKHNPRACCGPVAWKPNTSTGRSWAKTLSDALRTKVLPAMYTTSTTRACS